MKTFLNFIQPYISSNPDTRESFIKKVDRGILIWNIATAKKFPEEPFSKLLEDEIRDFEAGDLNQGPLGVLMHRKHQLFNDYRFFIVDRHIMFPTGGFFITVSVVEIQ